jgi:hypothetical protein
MTTKGRKPTSVEASELPALPDENVTGMLQSAEDLGAGIKMVLGYEGSFRRLGQLEAFEFTRQIVDVATAQIFEELKNSKGYIGLPYVGQDGITRQIGTFAEFCEVKLGKSYNRCLELSQNLRVLGPELYEQSERLGLRNVDYKALRALPGEDQALVRKAIEETGSREEVIDLLQEMAARHHGEKESFAQQLKSKDDVMLSKQKLIDYQADQIDSLSEKARFVAVASPSEKLEGIRTELLAHAAGIEGALSGKLAPCFAALKEHLAEHGGECDAYLSSTLGQIERAVREIRESFGLLRADDVVPWANAE